VFRVGEKQQPSPKGDLKEHHQDHADDSQCRETRGKLDRDAKSGDDSCSQTQPRDLGGHGPALDEQDAIRDGADGEQKEAEVDSGVLDLQYLAAEQKQAVFVAVR